MAAAFGQRLARALGRYAVAVIGEEPRLAYNPCCCPRSWLTRSASTTSSSGQRWWRDRGVTLATACVRPRSTRPRAT
jgi:nitrite reductase (NADH) large subunit